MDVVNLLISLASGAIGGNAAGVAMPDKSQGTLWNSIIGLLGGTGGTMLLQALGFLAGEQGVDVTSILANVGTSGVGGAILLVIVSLIKKTTSK